MRESHDAVLVRVADVLKKEIPVVEIQLSKHGLCQIATSLLDQHLKAAGFDAQILEGDLIIAPHETLEHRVNWVRTPEHWVIIDLTVAQIPKQKNKRVLIKMVAPNYDTLKQMLQSEYNWWFPEEKK